METIIRAVLEQEWLVLVGALVHVVPKLVMNGDEVDIANLDAHLDSQIVEVIDIPRAGVADHIAITRLGQERAYPKRIGQRSEAQGFIEAFAVAHHSLGIKILGLQQRSQIVTAALLIQTEDGEDVAPLLGPGIAEQVRGDWSVGRNDLRPVLLHQPGPNIGMQRKIKRTD